jgi:tetratricopeptide (TPR) repeat protein
MQLYTGAKSAEQSGDIASAISKYQSILEVAPRLGPAYNNLGALYLRLHQYTKAIVILKQGLEVDRSMYSATVLLGIAYYETGDYMEARQPLEAAVRANPKDNNAEHWPGQSPGGPSWLTFLGHMKESLWSMDLFRCESVILRTHWVLVVSVLDYDPVFVFSLVMCVRLDAVENIFHLFSGTPPEYQATTPTSITQLQYFFPGHRGKKEYSASTEEDMEAAVRELSAIRGKILRFFDQHQDVKALDAAMNCEEASDFDRSGQPYGAMHGVILARLANNARF